MAAVLVVAAERGELEDIVDRCGRMRRQRWPLDFAVSAEHGGQNFVLVANGPGPLAAEATRVALTKGEFRAVVSTGYCGALEPAYRAGDIVVATRVDRVERNLGYGARAPSTARPCRSGPVLSLDRVALTAEEKAKLRVSGAVAVEMEAAAVAAEARAAGVPFYCVRVVLDEAVEAFRLDFNRLRRSDGRFSRVRIGLAALAHPRVVLPELIRIRRKTRLASRALGEFFGDCRF